MSKYSGIDNSNKPAFDAIVPKVKDAIANGDIEVPSLDIGDIINLGTMYNSQAPIGDDYECGFSKNITKEEFNKIGVAGLAIIMFNTTCVILPYSKGQPNRFVANCIYNNNGQSMLTRWQLGIYYDDEEHIGFIRLISDTSYGNSVKNNSMNLPYGIIRFIKL